MSDFRHKQRMRRILYSRLTLCCLAAMVLIAGWKTWDIWGKERMTAAALRHSRAEFGELKAREEFLEARIERLGTAAGAEAEIRERYGVAKPDEEVIVLVDDENTGTTTQSVTFFGRFKRWWRE